jgi:hypothetical protein
MELKIVDKAEQETAALGMKIIFRLFYDPGPGQL